eukprot:155321-Pelagomonas_calceolata.AAC.1
MAQPCPRWLVKTSGSIENQQGMCFAMFPHGSCYVPARILPLEAKAVKHALLHIMSAPAGRVGVLVQQAPAHEVLRPTLILAHHLHTNGIIITMGMQRRDVLSSTLMGS